MVSQLIWIECVMKLAVGAALLVAPRLTIRIAGLADGGESFWPRLVGAMLIALAGGSYLQGGLARTNGLGLAGSALVNLTLALVIGALLILGSAATVRRGRILLWGVVVLLVIVCLIELAWA